MNSDDPLRGAIERICANDRTAMRTLLAETNQKVFGVIVLLLSKETDQRQAMLETYKAIWESRNERSGATDSHLDWILAIARRCALRLRTQTKTPPGGDQSKSERLAHFSAAPVYEQASLSSIEQSILIDSFVAAEDAALLERRYNLKSGQVLTELRRIIRRIGETER